MKAYKFIKRMINNKKMFIIQLSQTFPKIIFILKNSIPNNQLLEKVLIKIKTENLYKSKILINKTPKNKIRKLRKIKQIKKIKKIKKIKMISQIKKL